MGPSLVIALSLFSLLAEKNSCGVCHGAPQVEFDRSIHKDKGVVCTTCHGGDPADLTMNAMSRGKGFKGKIPKKEVPRLCAGCHSNVPMMLQYGEYVDQFAVYKESIHGKLLYGKDDTRVAVCTDCHGAHEIRSPRDPLSSVYKLNVPMTCARCHSDRDMMAPYGIPTDQFEKYKGSVHGVLRLEKRDLRSPGCPECHGVHGAHPPGVTEVLNICGQCHFRQREYFRKSPHYRAMTENKVNECASCHGSHGIHRPTHDLCTEGIGGAEGTGCLGCHQKGSPEAQRGEEMRAAFLGAERAIREAEHEIDLARVKGFEVDEERVKIEEARAKVTEALPAVHSLAIGLVGDYTKSAQMNAQEVRELVHAKIIEYRDRRVMFVSYIILFLAVVTLLLVKRRSLR